MASFLRSAERQRKREKHRVETREKVLLHTAQSCCEGKKPYISYAHAERHLHFRQDAKLPGRMRPYKCRVCNQYHIGRSEKMETRIVEEVES